MMKILSIVLIALILVLVAPAPVQACDGFLCVGTLFNVTERKQIEANKQTEIARIQADAETRIQEAQAQLQREVESGKLAQAQAQAQADQFIAMVEAQRDQKLTEIKLSYEQAAAMIESQSQVAIAGINETGETERHRIAWDSSYNIVTVLIIAGIVLYAMRRQRAQPTKVLMITGAPRPPIAAKYGMIEYEGDVDHPMERYQ